MKKILFLVLIILFVSIECFAGNNGRRSVIARKNTAAGGCTDSGTTHWFCDGGAGTTDCDGTNDGFESPWAPVGNSGNWDSYENAPASEGSTVKSGSISMRCNASNEHMVVNVSSQTEVWYDFWVYYVNGPTSEAFRHLMLYQEDYGAEIYVEMDYNDDTLRMSDGVNTWDTEVVLGNATWYHIFIHLELASGNGSETIQIAVNSVATWDAWDLNNTSATISPTNNGYFEFGLLETSDTPTDVIYDMFRSFYGTDMPCEWE